MQAWIRLIPALALALACARTQAAEDLGAKLRECRGEADAAARLACYDRLADRTQGAEAAAPAPAAVATAAPPAAPSPASPAAASPTAAPAAAAAAAAAATAPANAEEAFGRERRVQAEQEQQRKAEARALGALEATVTAIENRMDGLMTITLDNGQVWRQNRPDSKFRLKVGERVKIQPGALNSYILSGSTNRSTRVTRVD
ncbi:MAG TPA: hypothetical protein VFM30_00990 [Steroidobacteraceae bacterium]|nr:hypothetical protein [Steroidobacteraceae bacterium]